MANDTDTTTIVARSLNDFPEHVLVYIISLLPTYDAVRTTAISRRWRNLWTTIPFLNFDYSMFPHSPDNLTLTRRRFAEFVDRTLLHRPRLASPLKFRFQFDFGDYIYGHLIDSWILYAVNHDAVELDIDFFIDPLYHNYLDPDEKLDYDFNFFSLANSKIRVLKIISCDLIMPYDMSGYKYASINSIFLGQIYLADEMVSDLITGCVNLESLVIEDCYGMEKLRICSKKLKKLLLWFYFPQNEEESWVEIRCPNLRMISIYCFKMGKYLMEQADPLTEARVEFMHREDRFKYWNKVVRLFDGVMQLKVQNWWYEFFEQKDVSSKRFALNKLRFLELQTGYAKDDVLGLAALLEICPNLHTMILVYLNKQDEEKSLSEDLLNKPINLSMPSLKQVKMKHFGGTESEVQFLTLLKTQGTVLEKIVIVPLRVTENFPAPIVLRRRPTEVNPESAPFSAEG